MPIIALIEKVLSGCPVLSVDDSERILSMMGERSVPATFENVKSGFLALLHKYKRLYTTGEAGLTTEEKKYIATFSYNLLIDFQRLDQPAKDRFDSDFTSLFCVFSYLTVNYYFPLKAAPAASTFFLIDPRNRSYARLDSPEPAFALKAFANIAYDSFKKFESSPRELILHAVVCYAMLAPRYKADEENFLATYEAMLDELSDEKAVAIFSEYAQQYFALIKTHCEVATEAQQGMLSDRALKVLSWLIGLHFEEKLTSAQLDKIIREAEILKSLTTKQVKVYNPSDLKLSPAYLKNFRAESAAGDGFVIMPTNAMLAAPSGLLYRDPKDGLMVARSSALQLAWAARGLNAAGMSISVIKPVGEITKADLCAVHSAAYIDELERTAQLARRFRIPLPVDAGAQTYVTATSIQAVKDSCLSIFTALQRAKVKGDGAVIHCLLRPPGHHAKLDEAMGFCLVNNVAVAVRKFGGKVGIVDVDIHSGNGTREIIEAGKLPSVLEGDESSPDTHLLDVFETTNFPYSEDEPGVAGTSAQITSLPFSADEKREVIVVGILAKIDELWPADKLPEVFLISFGLDGHRCDPLGHWSLQPIDYLTIIQHLRNKGVGVVLATEGGYSYQAQFYTNKLLAKMLVHVPAAYPASELAEHDCFAAPARKPQVKRGRAAADDKPEIVAVASSFFSSSSSGAAASAAGEGAGASVEDFESKGDERAKRYRQELSGSTRSTAFFTYIGGEETAGAASAASCSRVPASMGSTS